MLQNLGNVYEVRFAAIPNTMTGGGLMDQMPPLKIAAASIDGAAKLALSLNREIISVTRILEGVQW